MRTPTAYLKQVALVALLAIGFCGCESEESTQVSGGVYYGVGFYDPWYYGDYYYDRDVIITPPEGRPPEPTHPIALPPGGDRPPQAMNPIAPTPSPRPTPMPSIPSMPRVSARR
jgi:hypothetical protein